MLRRGDKITLYIAETRKEIVKLTIKDIYHEKDGTLKVDTEEPLRPGKEEGPEQVAIDKEGKTYSITLETDERGKWWLILKPVR